VVCRGPSNPMNTSAPHSARCRIRNYRMPAGCHLLCGLHQHRRVEPQPPSHRNCRPPTPQWRSDALPCCRPRHARRGRRPAPQRSSDRALCGIALVRRAPRRHGHRHHRRQPKILVAASQHHRPTPDRRNIQNHRLEPCRPHHWPKNVMALALLIGQPLGHLALGRHRHHGTPLQVFTAVPDQLGRGNRPLAPHESSSNSPNISRARGTSEETYSCS